MQEGFEGLIVETRELLLQRLDGIVAGLLGVYREIPHPEIMVYELWTAKDILAHLTFWHESFARNVGDLVDGKEPKPLKGRFRDLNQEGVEAMRSCSLAEVIRRFEAAHSIIQANILDSTLGSIPYKKGSRDYSPEEHLDVVIKHIEKHSRDVRKAISKRRRRDGLAITAQR